MSNSANPIVLWDWGTAYDLFISLHVLHHPERFGLRPSWAAGVRSRLPAAERKFLEDAQNLYPLPALWVYSLPEPKDAGAALSALSRIPAAERLPALSWSLETPAEMRELLQQVSAAGRWSPGDLERLRAMQPPARAGYDRNHAGLLNWWLRPAEFGEQMLLALQAYYSVFFAEEEARIRPALQAGLALAQEQAQKLSLTALLEQLSQGVHFPTLGSLPEVVLAPAYWITPLVYYGKPAPQRMLFVFGARPMADSLVPGEVVPAALLSSLKALADPTRLQVLRCLAQETLTLSQLSRRLRLRMPTMIHHLNALRLAGLVNLSLEEGGEKRYALRREAAAATFQSLLQFLEKQEDGLK